MCVRSLKVKLIFVVGFFIGFTFALLFIGINNQHEFVQCKKHKPFLLRAVGDNAFANGKWIKPDPQSRKITSDESYINWLKNKNVTIRDVNMDSWRYAPPSTGLNNSTVLESEWLKSNIHITCVVLVEKVKLAQSIKDTWGPSCNKVYFFSQDLKDTTVPVINLSIKLTSSWQLLCEVMHWIWKASTEVEPLEWIIFIRDDTMVLPENLRHMVAPLDFNDGYYLGHSVVLWGQPYNIAQAGYVLSRGAFRKIIETFDTHEKCATSGKYWKKEDYYLGKHLAELDIHPTDTRDQYMRGTFHGYPLQTLLWGVARPGSYFTRALYPPGDDCCSPRSVTFGISEPDKLHTINYMLYHLNVYKEEGYYGNKPAPTPVPEQDVWKIALKEEFNLTDVDNISDDQFYQIWRSRYTEPSQFINKNYQNIPGVLHSILTAYESDRKVVTKP